jgi:hypothetical protein
LMKGERIEAKWNWTWGEKKREHRKNEEKEGGENALVEPRTARENA